MDYWVSYSFYCPASHQTKSKSMKKHRSRATALVSHSNGHNLQFLWCTAIKDFLALVWVNKMIPRFNCWSLPSPRVRRLKKFTDFFKIHNYLPNVFQFFILKNLYCAIMFGSVFLDVVTLVSFFVNNSATNAIVCLGSCISSWKS